MLIRASIVLGALAACGVASATNLFTYHGLVAEMSRAVDINFNGKSMTVGAGLAKVSLDGGSKFGGMCVDLSHWNTNGSSYQVNVKPIAERGATASQAAWLFGKYANNITSKDMGAALQLAVWDIVYDGGDGLNSGSFKSSASSSIKTLTNGYIAESKNQSGAGYYFKAITHGYKNDCNQDYMSTVPEPASMAVLLTGAAAVIRRRRKAK